MSSVGHLFVGAAASRYAVRPISGPRNLAFAGLLTAIAIAPDLDLTVLPSLGVPESLTLGHRGATHSLVVALVVTLLVTLLAKILRLTPGRVALGAFLAIGSHALLDSLTPGPGVAWLWPFTPMRFPTLPILPQPPFSDFFGPYWTVMLFAEMAVFAPFLAYAILARPNPAPER